MDDNVDFLTVDMLRDFIKDIHGENLVGVELDNGNVGIIKEVTWNNRSGIIFKIKVME